ncbi:MAG: hypothetical protein SHS37scaffold220_13 [Phage 67_12]|nr:MAG: hypothetical protein SHS37scaffold220_13 [Phage 67_12]
MLSCPYCARPAVLVTGATIYPHRVDLYAKKFWRCAPCGAWVGCHPAAGPKGQGGIGDGTVALGRLANAELRTAKARAHAAFDPLWKSRAMKRRDAYAWLAGQLGISRDNCHIGMMDLDACRAVVAAIQARRLAA